MDYMDLELKLNNLINRQVEHIENEIKGKKDLPNHLVPSSKLYVNQAERLLMIEIRANKNTKLDIYTLKYHNPFLKINGNCTAKAKQIELNLPSLDQASLIPKFYQQENRQFELTFTLPHQFGDLPNDVRPIYAKFILPNVLNIFIPLF